MCEHEHCVLDDEFEPTCGSSDDEETIAREEAEQCTTDVSRPRLIPLLSNQYIVSDVIRVSVVCSTIRQS